MRIVPVTSSAKRSTVSDTAAQFDLEMADGEFWVLSTTTACYVAQGDDPTATAGDGSLLIGDGHSALIDGSLGPVLSIVRATTSGEATLTRAKILE